MRDREIPWTTDSSKTDWHSVEKTLGIVGKVERLICEPVADRAVFICAAVVWKVNLRRKRHSEILGFQDLGNEKRFLERLALTGYVPDVLEFVELDSMEALCVKRVNGLALDKYRPGFLEFFLLHFRAARAINEFAKYGVAHGDLAPQNIIIGGSGRLYFIDFGHAYDSPYPIALFRSLFVKRIRHPGFNRPYTVTVVRMIEFSLPPLFRGPYRKLLRIGKYKSDRPEK